MTAIRSVRAAEGKFAQISNAALQDRRLSLSARGILAFVLSLPPEKTFSARWLETQVPDGRREVRSALKELEACGYYSRTKTSAGGTWVWDQVISDAPLEVPSENVAGQSIRPEAVICDEQQEREFPQVPACDRFAPDANRSDKELKTEPPKTEDLPNTKDQKMASRRGRASGTTAELTDQAKIEAVRQAAVDVYATDSDISDGECLALYDHSCRNYDGQARKIRNVRAYMSKLFEDAPDVHSLLSNATAYCHACWEPDAYCACPAGAQSAA